MSKYWFFNVLESIYFPVGLENANKMSIFLTGLISKIYVE